MSLLLRSANEVKMPRVMTSRSILAEPKLLVEPYFRFGYFSHELLFYLWPKIEPHNSISQRLLF
jgi:hypothetical protein